MTVKADKMELMIGDNLINDEHPIPILITSDMIVKSFVKGYHAYKDLWKPFINEELTTAMEPDNAVDKTRAKLGAGGQSPSATKTIINKF